jgi:hypothetical protein
MEQGTGCSLTAIQYKGLEYAALHVIFVASQIFHLWFVMKPIYLRKNIIFLDSVVEIYKHWNTAETLVSYSGTKSLVAEWCSFFLWAPGS